MSIEVSIDIESMSVASTASIISIGAVKFDTTTPGVLGVPLDPNDQPYQHFYCTIPLQSSIDAGLTVDGKTVEWWMEQSEDAKKALMEEPRWELEKALSELHIWFGHESLPVWGLGSDFDNVVLTNAYRKLGGQPPWRFRHNRCLRTMRALYPDVEYVAPELKHHALSDALSQALQIQNIYQRIRENTHGPSSTSV